MRPTVYDIARQAGVSLATVDRVLNGRPGVRQKTIDRVGEAVRNLGYVRDVSAANLARRRDYQLVFILPEGPNSFMRNMEGEVRAAMARAAQERMAIKLITVPAIDSDALADALDGLEADKVAGVALVATDAPRVREAVDRLVEVGVAVVTLVSDLPQSQRSHFCGIDNVAAGRTAAGLIGRFLPEGAGRILVVAGSMKLADHRDRAKGFAEVMEREFPGVSLSGPLEGLDDPDIVRRLVGDALEADHGIDAIYSLGAGNRGLVDVLSARRGKRLPVVVHEVTAHSRRALEEGLIDAVINQDCGHEVRSAIRVMKAKADGVGPVEAQERIRIDVFLRDNLL